MQQRSLSGASRRLLWVASPMLVLLLVLGVMIAAFHSAPKAHAAVSLPNPWWKSLTTQRTLNAVNYGHTLQDVQNNLDTYQAEGYQVINLDWPVSAGPTAIFGGFAGADYYHVDPRLAAPGTNADTDWTNFTAAVHSRGMAVDSWFNPSYVWTGAALVKQAEADVLQYGTVRANLPATSPARYFDWRSQAGTVTKPCDSCGGSGGNIGVWVTDPDAGTNVSYYSFWADQPTADYSSTEWRTYIKGAIQHWMDTGLDGFVFDDPFGYYNCSGDCVSSVITGPINAYGNKVAFTENNTVGAGWGGNHNRQYNGAYPTALDTAIANQNPANLPTDESFTDRTYVSGNGMVPQLSLRPQDLNDDAKNLLKAATITSSGNMLDIFATGVDNGGYEDFGDFGTWPDTTAGVKLKAISDAQRNTPAFDLTGPRTIVATNNDNKYLAYLRSTAGNSQEALVVLNYQNSQQTISVDLSTHSIIADQTTGDALNGGNGPTLSGTSFSVTLPAWGYGFYTLNSSTVTNTATPTSPPSATATATTPPTATATAIAGGTTIDDNASGWTYSGWSAYSDGGAYQGTAHGGSGNGAHGQYTFTGSRVDVYTWKGPDGGTVQVCVDTTCSATLSLSNATNVYNQDIYSATGLTNGSHTVKITANSTDSSKWEMVDYLVVSNGGGTPTATATTIPPTATGVPPTSTPIPPTATPGGGGGTTTTVDDNASGWTYSGWSSYTDGAAYGGSAHGGSGNGAYGQYTFTGTGVDVYTWKGPDGGTVQVCVDTTCSSTLSLSNTTDNYNQKIYSVSGLSNGSHTVKITANSTNGSKWEMVDYLVYTH